MANRYWVGTVASNWNTTTNWSSNSGGPSGASIPTAADDVFIDGATGAANITLASNSVCKSINTTGAACAFNNAAGNFSYLTVSGNVTFSATTTWTGGGALKVIANATVTTNNITMQGPLIIEGVGITVGLGSNYTSQIFLNTGFANTQGLLIVNQGTFNTNNFTINLSTDRGPGFVTTNSILTRTINLGSSVINVNCSTPSAVYAWDCSTTTGLTFNPGTSTLYVRSENTSVLGFHGGGLTYYSGVIITNTAAVNNNLSIQGANTWNGYLEFDTQTSNQTAIFLIGANQTVAGGLFVQPLTTGGNYRVLVYSDVQGTARTISAPTALNSLTDVDFRDITKAGAGGNWTGTRLGNAGGNSGITFPSKTVYWNNTTASQAWNSNSWAASSGGAVAVANFPLPQDTVVFSNTGTVNNLLINGTPASSTTLPTAYVWMPAAITATGMTNVLFIADTRFNNCTFTNTSTINFDATNTFNSRATQSFGGTTGPIFSGLNLNSPTNQTFQLSAAWTTPSFTTLVSGTFSLNGFDYNSSSSGFFNLTGGTLNLGTNTLSVSTFTSSNSNVRTINFGTGSIVCKQGNSIILALNTGTATNLSYTGTPSVSFTGTTAFISAHETGGTAANTFDIIRSSGTGIIFTTGSSIRNLNFTGYTGSWSPGTRNTTFYGNVTLVPGMTFTTPTTSIWTFRGASGVQTLTSAGKTLKNITVANTGTSFQLADTTTLSTGAITLSAGTFDVNSQTFTGYTTLGIQTGSSTIINAPSGLTFTSVTHSSGTFTLNSTAAISTTGAYTLTAGTLALGSNTLTALTFSSSGSSTRSINFDTGQITLTGNNATIWNMATATNFTRSGTTKIVSNYAGSTGTRTFSFGSITVPFIVGAGSGNEFSFNTTATDTVTFLGSIASLDSTGFTGTWSQGANAMSITPGNLTLDAGTTVTAGAGAISFTATSGTQSITSAGKTINPITQNGVGGTVSLADNLALTSTGTYTLTNGTFNANNNNLTVGLFSSTNSNIRTITMGSGTWTLSGTGTVWNCATSTNLTVNPDTSTIVLSDTSTTARTFAGGGKTYNNLTIGGLTGTSVLTLSGSNTFNTIASTKTVAHTITFTAGTTTTVSDWTAKGTLGNILTINSSTPGSQATLNKAGPSIVSELNYLSIRDSNATPIWYAGDNSTDVSNNTGWVFATYFASSGNFLFFF
jgi:hypothetical protein